MTTIVTEAVTLFLAERSQDAQTLLGIAIVLPLLVLALLAGETVRTSALDLPGLRRPLSAVSWGLVALFCSVVIARFASLT